VEQFILKIVSGNFADLRIGRERIFILCLSEFVIPDCSCRESIAFLQSIPAKNIPERH
jgi:hypothetical protein